MPRRPRASATPAGLLVSARAIRLLITASSGRGASHSSGSPVTTNSRGASAILACAGLRPSQRAVSSSSLVSVSGGLASRARMLPGRPDSRSALVSVVATAILDSGGLELEPPFVRLKDGLFAQVSRPCPVCNDKAIDCACRVTRETVDLSGKPGGKL